MNQYDLKLQMFMDKLGRGEASVPEEVLVSSFKSVAKEVHRTLNGEGKERKFTLRMSNLGKPLCQLQMEALGNAREPLDTFSLIKFSYGHTVEGLTMAVLKAAGFEITREQERVTLVFTYEDGTVVNIDGSNDFVMDGKVWDVKSASSFSYNNKFLDYDFLKDNDPFGYVAQLYGYAHGLGVPAGGWVVVNKETADIKFITVPEFQQKDKAEYLKRMKDAAFVVIKNAPFEKRFEDEVDYFRGKPTGHRVLGSVCSFCPYKEACWPGVIQAPDKASTAKSPRMKWYTHIKKD